MISPSARNFLNSTFVNVQGLHNMESELHLGTHQTNAAQRDIRNRDHVRIHNNPGLFVAKAYVIDKARQGWWSA